MSISIGTAGAQRALGVVFTFVYLALAVPAAAQDSADSYDAIIAEAVSEYDEGMWQEARILFKRAHVLKPSARTWYGIGISAFQAQRYVEASEALQAALSDTRKPLTPTQKHDAESVLGKAVRYVARVKLSVQPADAAVMIDGVAVTPSAEGVLVDPGAHEIAVSAAGHKTALRRLTVDGGSETTFAIELDEASADDSDDTVITPPPVARQESSSTLLWVGLSASGAVAITGGVLLGVGLSDAASVEDAAPGTRWSEIEAAHDRAAPLQTVGAILLGVGGAGLAISTFLLLSGDSEESPAVEAAIVPGGVQVWGRL